MNNKEKLQGLSAEDREIQMWVSTKQKEHSGLTGLTLKLPVPVYRQAGTGRGFREM